ncbi:MAG TPA: hypothetical protein VED63_11375, partial [Acidimicrobiales bacterium]|nr:hypothetical protein [Acidimicrobiales bacterium]
EPEHSDTAVLLMPTPPTSVSDTVLAPTPDVHPNASFWGTSKPETKTSRLARVPFTLLMQVGIAIVVVAVVLFTLG